MMVRFHGAASTELVGARDWYERARPGLGLAFAVEVERVISLIDQFPFRFPVHQDGMRRASLRRFPFSIYFEDMDGVRYVWGVFHHRRDRANVERRQTD